MVIDTSAIICILFSEPERDLFATTITDSGSRLLPASCYVECALVLSRRSGGRALLNDFLAKARIGVMEFDERQARLAADAFERFGRGSGHPAKLNFGDCLAYAPPRRSARRCSSRATILRARTLRRLWAAARTGDGACGRAYPARMIPAPKTIVAFNTAAASENRIHDDATARRFGFTGALVPGVEVYAYMCRMPVAVWGRAFLERGAAKARFFKPVYDGEKATIAAEAAPDGLALTVDSAGARSATGSASPSHPETAPSPADYAAARPPATRPPAGFDSLPVGGALGIEPVAIDVASLKTYLADIRDDDPLYASEGIVHPGQLLRLCNAALVQNVVLGPWIHVGSSVRNFAAARLGQTLTLRSRITSNAETKGHAIVTFDALVLADGAPVSRVEHVAIWRPRQVAQAA